MTQTPPWFAEFANAITDSQTVGLTSSFWHFRFDNGRTASVSPSSVPMHFDLEDSEGEVHAPLSTGQAIHRLREVSELPDIPADERTPADAQATLGNPNARVTITHPIDPTSPEAHRLPGMCEAEWTLAELLRLLDRLDESAQDLDTDLIRAAIPTELRDHVLTKYEPETDDVPADAQATPAAPDGDEECLSVLDRTETAAAQ